jgi:hypothetical protein
MRRRQMKGLLMLVSTKHKRGQSSKPWKLGAPHAVKERETTGVCFAVRQAREQGTKQISQRSLIALQTCMIVGREERIVASKLKGNRESQWHYRMSDCLALGRKYSLLGFLLQCASCEGRSGGCLVLPGSKPRGPLVIFVFLPY